MLLVSFSAETNAALNIEVGDSGKVSLAVALMVTEKISLAANESIDH